MSTPVTKSITVRSHAKVIPHNILGKRRGLKGPAPKTDDQGVDPFQTIKQMNPAQKQAAARELVRRVQYGLQKQAAAIGGNLGMGGGTALLAGLGAMVGAGDGVGVGGASTKDKIKSILTRALIGGGLGGAIGATAPLWSSVKSLTFDPAQIRTGFSAATKAASAHDVKLRVVQALVKQAKVLSDKARADLPKKDFAQPKSKGYPMPDARHAAAALGFAAMHHGKDSDVYKRVRAKAHALGYGKAEDKKSEKQAYNLPGGLGPMSLSNPYVGAGLGALGGAGLGYLLGRKSHPILNAALLGGLGAVGGGAYSLMSSPQQQPSQFHPQYGAGAMSFAPDYVPDPSDYRSQLATAFTPANSNAPAIPGLDLSGGQALPTGPLGLSYMPPTQPQAQGFGFSTPSPAWMQAAGVTPAGSQF